MKAERADRNRVGPERTGRYAQDIGFSLSSIRRSSMPGRWLLVVLCLDVLWLAYVRLPSLLGGDLWLGLAAQDTWIPAMIVMLLVPAEVYLAWLVLARQYRGKLATGRTSALMAKVLSESTPWQCATDPAGRFTYCGPESLHLVGYEPSELPGHHFSRIINPEDLADLLQESSRKTDSTGDWTGVRTIYRHRLESRVLVDISAKARTGPAGEYQGLEGRTRSLRPGTITDTAARETWQRLQTLMEGRYLSTAFQPVWSLSSGRPIGVEALTRFSPFNGAAGRTFRGRRVRRTR